MNTFYLGGPMRGIKNFNFPLFNAATRMLRAAGYGIISPAEEDRVNGEPWTRYDEPDYANDQYPITEQDVRRLVRRDIDLIMTLRREDGDGIIVLPRWQFSTGAHAEAGVGDWLALPILEFSFQTFVLEQFTLTPVVYAKGLGTWLTGQMPEVVL